jgi:hypothetical protein
MTMTQSEAPYATCSISIVSTSQQIGQEKTSNSGSAPSFGMVRTSFMVRRQRGHGMGCGSWLSIAPQGTGQLPLPQFRDHT